MKSLLGIILFGPMLFLGCRDKQGEPQLADTTAAPAAGIAKGVAVESQDGRFAIILPEGFPSPEMSTKQVPTDIGEVTMYLYTTSAADGSTIIVSYNDYPEAVFVKPKSTMMDHIRDGALANMGATLESQRDFMFADLPARSLDFSVVSEGSQGYGRIQYFIDQPRLYQLLYVSFAENRRNEPEIKQTFSSFRLLK